MSYEESLTKVSLPVNADSSALQYRFMTVNSSGQLAATGNAGAADGVLQDDPDTAGDAGSLAIAGISKVEVGVGGLTAGDDIGSDATGRAITAASGDIVLGRALVTSSVGDLASALLKLSGSEPLS